MLLQLGNQTDKPSVFLAILSILIYLFITLFRMHMQFKLAAGKRLLFLIAFHSMYMASRALLCLTGQYVIPSETFFRMGMLLCFAYQYTVFIITACFVNMLRHLTHKFSLFSPVTSFCMYMACSLLLPADLNLLFCIASLRMLMHFYLRKHTCHFPIDCIAVVVMLMYNIIGVSAYQVLLSVIALWRMLMHLHPAVKHFHLLRHCLSHHPQRGHSTKTNHNGHTNKHNKPLFMFLPFCQQSCNLL